MRLSILTLTLPERHEECLALRDALRLQRGERTDVEHVIVSDDGSMPCGTKMARGIEMCTGDYVATVDDDDMVDPDYTRELLAILDADDPDVVTFDVFRADISKTWSFHMGARDGEMCGQVQQMMANHLCCWKRSLALSVPWIPLNYGPDVVWYHLMNAAYPNAREVHIPRSLYLYRYDPKRTRCQRKQDFERAMRLTSGGLDGWRADDGRLLVSSAGRDLQTDPKSVMVLDANGRTELVPSKSLERLVTVRLG